MKLMLDLVQVAGTNTNISCVPLHKIHILKYMPNLHTLTVSGTPGLPSNRTQTMFVDDQTRSHFRNLTTLKLVSVDLAQSYVEQFLEPIKSTLRTLEMDRVATFEGCAYCCHGVLPPSHTESFFKPVLPTLRELTVTRCLFLGEMGRFHALRYLVVDFSACHMVSFPCSVSHLRITTLKMIRNNGPWDVARQARTWIQRDGIDLPNLQVLSIEASISDWKELYYWGIISFCLKELASQRNWTFELSLEYKPVVPVHLYKPPLRVRPKSLLARLMTII